jgi:hypothetical protein
VDYKAETALGKFWDSGVIAGLGFKVMQAGLRALGFERMVAELDVRWLAAGFYRYAGDVQGSVAFAADLSDYMRQRNLQRMNDLDELEKRLENEGGSTPAELVLDVFMLQARQIAEFCCWLAGFEQNMKEGMGESLAIMFADRQVAALAPEAGLEALRAAAGEEPLRGLFNNFYRYASIAYSKGNAGHANEEQRTDQIADFLLVQSIPLALTKFLAGKIKLPAAQIFPLTSQMISTDTLEYLPQLLILHDFEQGMAAQGGNIEKALSKGEYLESMAPGGGLSPWLTQLMSMNEFEKDIYQAAAKIVAGAEGEQRDFRRTAIKRGWWWLLK